MNFKVANTSADVFDDGIDRITAMVAQSQDGFHNYIQVNNQIWGSGVFFLADHIQHPDIVIARGYAPGVFYLNLTYFDPALGVVLDQVSFDSGYGFGSEFTTVLDNDYGNGVNMPAAHIDIDQENRRAVLVWQNPKYKEIRTAYLDINFGVCNLSPISVLPNFIELFNPDVAVSMDDAFFSFTDEVSSHIFVKHYSISSINAGQPHLIDTMMLCPGAGMQVFEPCIATSCETVNHQVEWTLVTGAGVGFSQHILGWTSHGMSLYNTSPFNYTNSNNWPNKTMHFYQMDAANVQNAHPAITYQHNGSSNVIYNKVQIAWVTNDALSGLYGKQYGGTTIVNVTCNNAGNPIAVANTGTGEPEYQIAPYRWTANTFPAQTDSSGVSNLNFQSAVSLCGRNAFSYDEVLVYFDAANPTSSMIASWDELLFKDGINSVTGLRHSPAVIPNHSGLAHEVPVVKVYPNPFTEHVMIQLPENSTTDTWDALLVSVNGQAVAHYTGEAAQLNNAINESISNWSAGAYYLQLRQNGQFVAQQKLIKQ